MMTTVRARRIIALLSLAAIAMVSTIHAQTPRKNFQVLRLFQDRFTFEYPSKDWDAVPGGTSSLVALTHKKHEATVVVEYQPLRLELAPSEIDDHFAKLEVEPVTTRQTNAASASVRLVDIGANKVIVVDFDRKGVMGAEHVRQYSLPIGKHLYRLVCSAPAASFGKYEPVFAAMVETFRLAGAAPAKS